MKKKLASAILSCVVSFAVAFATTPGLAGARRPSDRRSSRSPAQLTPEQLQQLVAPIALYPDALVAQILAASAYPTQIVEAERFLRDKIRS